MLTPRAIGLVVAPHRTSHGTESLIRHATWATMRYASIRQTRILSVNAADEERKLAEEGSSCGRDYRCAPVSTCCSRSCWHWALLSMSHGWCLRQDRACRPKIRA